jgi:hypothetical protein
MDSRLAHEFKNRRAENSEIDSRPFVCQDGRRDRKEGRKEKIRIPVKTFTRRTSDAEALCMLKYHSHRHEALPEGSIARQSTSMFGATRRHHVGEASGPAISTSLRVLGMWKLRLIA